MPYTNDTIVMNAFSIGGKKFANVPLSEMNLVPSYQRTETANVVKLTRFWDIKKCEVLHVSYRDGQFNIINGQHRFKSAKNNGVTHLPCQIEEGLTEKDEAMYFAGQNDNVRRLNTYDIFKANLICGEETDLAIKKVCDEYGVAVKKAGASATKVLKCLTLTRNIIKNSGENCLRWIFSIIKSSGWNHISRAYGFGIISSLHSLYVNSKDLNDTTSKIIKLLSENSYEKLKAQATLRFPNLSVDVSLKSYIEMQVIAMSI